MPNVAAVLKAEIARISRKEARSAVSPIRKPSVRYRKDIADLKRRLAILEKAGKEFHARLAKVEKAQPAPAAEPEQKARITAKGMKALRRKLGLSGDELARLVGVTGQAVYSWERGQGALRLRTATRAAVLAIRGIGAREARKRLEEMKNAKKAAKTRKAALRRRKKNG